MTKYLIYFLIVIIAGSLIFGGVQSCRLSSARRTIEKQQKQIAELKQQAEYLKKINKQDKEILNVLRKKLQKLYSMPDSDISDFLNGLFENSNETAGNTTATQTGN
jgi:cell division protein FtsB